LVASTRCDSAEAHVLTKGGYLGIRDTSWSVELEPGQDGMCVVRIRRELVTFSMPPQMREVAMAGGMTLEEIEANLARAEREALPYQGQEAECVLSQRELTARLLEMREGGKDPVQWQSRCTGTLVSDRGAVSWAVWAGWTGVT
jgi:hypothetical protein